MTDQEPLPVEKLYKSCDLNLMDFDDSSELAAMEPGFGQERALEAIEFALRMKHAGYHLFISGPRGVGKSNLVKGLIKQHLDAEERPDDWCYVRNFQQANKPVLLRLAAGKARQLEKSMLKLIEDLLDAIPAAFQGEEYIEAIREINDEYQSIEQKRFEALEQEAKKDNIVLIPTPHGYTMGPTENGKVLGPEDFNRLKDDEQEAIKERVEEYNTKLKDILEKLPQLKAEANQKSKDLNTWFTLLSVKPFIDRLRSQWQDEEKVLEFLDSVNESIVDNIGVFIRKSKDNTNISNNKYVSEPEYIPYHVNIFVDNADSDQVPIVFESNPTHRNLFGQVEYKHFRDTVVTDFTLLRAGAIHRANGGYLIIDAHKVLSNPFVWETLKRILFSNKVSVESIENPYGFNSGMSLQPELIPLDVKVVLIGDAHILNLLKTHDPEFSELFKVMADMAYEIPRSDDSSLAYAKLISTKIAEKQLLAFDKQAVARLIEHSARYVGDSEKLSLQLNELSDLIEESEYYAKQEHKETVDLNSVQLALQKRSYRYSKYAEMFQEQVVRGDILFNNEGGQVGEANALSVIRLGDYYFGRPTRISATARLGGGNVIDIERESDMAGSIHSKGVMILSAFIANRFAKDIPFALNATLVFEQSYGFVDGDSASALELCTLLSAIADVPIKQNFAVTGSVDQNGRVQAIGAVNEKIEGFFDICKATGSIENRAVIIPEANVKHLMLKDEVIEAVKQNQFQIYSVDNIDSMLALLTEMEPGEKDEKGIYPQDSFNGKVQQCVMSWSETLHKLKEKQ